MAYHGGIIDDAIGWIKGQATSAEGRITEAATASAAVAARKGAEKAAGRETKRAISSAVWVAAGVAVLYFVLRRK